ncbi:MAG: hypothetical protein AAB373_01940 [Patescibacteria group bacterium]
MKRGLQLSDYAGPEDIFYAGLPEELATTDDVDFLTLALLFDYPNFSPQLYIGWFGAAEVDKAEAKKYNQFVRECLLPYLYLSECVGIRPEIISNHLPHPNAVDVHKAQQVVRFNGLKTRLNALMRGPGQHPISFAKMHDLTHVMVRLMHGMDPLPAFNSGPVNQDPEFVNDLSVLTSEIAALCSYEAIEEEYFVALFGSQMEGSLFHLAMDILENPNDHPSRELVPEPYLQAGSSHFTNVFFVFLVVCAHYSRNSFFDMEQKLDDTQHAYFMSRFSSNTQKVWDNPPDRLIEIASAMHSERINGGKRVSLKEIFESVMRQNQ